MAQYVVKNPPEFSFKPAEWDAWENNWKRFHRQAGLRDKDDEDQIDSLMMHLGEKAESLLNLIRLG